MVKIQEPSILINATCLFDHVDSYCRIEVRNNLEVRSYEHPNARSPRLASCILHFCFDVAMTDSILRKCTRTLRTPIAESGILPNQIRKSLF